MVMCEVGCEVKLEVACTNRRTVYHKLHSGIVDLACVHPLLCPRSRCVHEHGLVLRSAIIICEVESETVLEELHVKTNLIRCLNLWLEVRIEAYGVDDRLAVAHLELELTYVVEIVRRRILTHLGCREAQLCERNPFRQTMVDGAHEVGHHPAE